MKTLTVSVAAYNVEKYLSHTLASLDIDELSDDLEVIIENDGSEDQTALIADLYVKKNPAIFKLNTTVNGGYGETINRSIALATGKYFKQLDGDDWFKKENLTDYIDFLKRIDSDLVISPYFKFYESTNKNEYVDRHQKITDNEKLDSYFEDENVSIHLHELTIKTSVLQQNHIMIDKHCFYTDNEYVFYPIIFGKTIARFNAPIYCYRIGRSEQSVGLNGRVKHWKDAGVVLEKLIDVYHNFEQSLGEPTKINLQEMILELAEFQYQNSALTEKKEAIQYLRDIDMYIKRSDKKIYDLMNERSFSIRLLRRSNYVLMPLYRKVLQKEMKI